VACYARERARTADRSSGSASAVPAGRWRFSVSMMILQGRFEAGRRRSDRSAARRWGRGSSTSRSRPSRRVRLPRRAPRRGLRVRIRPVWILIPARRAWSTRRSRAPSGPAPPRPRGRLQRELAGDGQDEDRVDHAVLADSFRGALKRGPALTSSPKIGTSAILYSSSAKSGDARGARCGSSCAGRGPGVCGSRSRPHMPDDHPGDADDASLRLCSAVTATQAAERADPPDHGRHRDLMAFDAHPPWTPVWPLAIPGRSRAASRSRRARS